MLRRITLQVAGMNRRLRKKTHRGEFTQYGFGLVVLLRMDPENDLLARRVAANDFLDRVIVEAERLGLRVAGGGGGDADDAESNRRFNFFFSSETSVLRPVAEREALLTWLDHQVDVRQFSLRDLVDAWHSSPKDSDFELDPPPPAVARPELGGSP